MRDLDTDPIEVKSLVPGIWIALGTISWDSSRIVCKELFDLDHTDHSRKASSLPLTLYIVELCYEQRRNLGFETAGISSHLYAAMARVELICNYYTIEEQDAIYRQLATRKKSRSPG